MVSSLRCFQLLCQKFVATLRCHKKCNN